MSLIRFVLFAIFFAFFAPAVAFAASYSISGRAIDTLNNLVINTSISVTDLHTNKIIAKTTTGLDGYYVITVPQGAYNITLVPQGQSGLNTITANDLVITSNTQHNFTLPIPNPTSADAFKKTSASNNLKTPGTTTTSITQAITGPNGSREIIKNNLAQGKNSGSTTPIIIILAIAILVGGGVGIWYWREKHKNPYCS